MTIPPLTPDVATTNPLTAARMAKHEQAVAWQASQTELFPGGWIIRPAIGRTGGVDNVGWELIAPPNTRPPRYLATRTLAIAEYEKLRNE